MKKQIKELLNTKLKIGESVSLKANPLTQISRSRFTDRITKEDKESVTLKINGFGYLAGKFVVMKSLTGLTVEEITEITILEFDKFMEEVKEGYIKEMKNGYTAGRVLKD